MSVLKWIKIEKHVLPYSSMYAYLSLDNTNKEVKCALQVGENEKVATPLIIHALLRFAHTLTISRSPNLKFANSFQRSIHQIFLLYDYTSHMHYISRNSFIAWGWAWACSSSLSSYVSNCSLWVATTKIWLFYPRGNKSGLQLTSVVCKPKNQSLKLTESSGTHINSSYFVFILWPFKGVTVNKKKGVEFLPWYAHLYGFWMVKV